MKIDKKSIRLDRIETLYRLLNYHSKESLLYSLSESLSMWIDTNCSEERLTRLKEDNIFSVKEIMALKNLTAEFDNNFDKIIHGKDRLPNDEIELFESNIQTVLSLESFKEELQIIKDLLD